MSLNSTSRQKNPVMKHRHTTKCNTDAKSYCIDANVIIIAAKCNNDAIGNNIDATCNKVFKAFISNVFSLKNCAYNLRGNSSRLNQPSQILVPGTNPFLVLYADSGTIYLRLSGRHPILKNVDAKLKAVVCICLTNVSILSITRSLQLP